MAVVVLLGLLGFVVIVVSGAVLSSFTIAVLVEPGAAPLLLALSLAVQLIALLPSVATVKAAFA